MKEKENELEIVGQATDNEDVAALKAEIDRLKEENANLTAENDKLTSERTSYSKWWQDERAENEKLKAIVKMLVAYAKLA